MCNFTYSVLFYTHCVILHTKLPYAMFFVARRLLSWNNALSSVKFRGLKLRLCKKKWQISGMTRRRTGPHMIRMFFWLWHYWRGHWQTRILRRILKKLSNDEQICSKIFLWQKMLLSETEWEKRFSDLSHMPKIWTLSFTLSVRKEVLMKITSRLYLAVIMVYFVH